ncbi:hypothetical protein CC99x_003915 [Candidatus Berkiella cookevillensis]|uniref:Uncharacterized protein n=1 Tax=Candidatus Berkiella cookevillensis TaxID=437022 RepID=A0A0Q9YCZ1_9GAMM|nr:hypothetical protein [Candidatus Berkiella cookevillensis]MCS5708045.1 hypothetical protein [Candidatus Berkiella cookevillensis]
MPDFIKITITNKDRQFQINDGSNTVLQNTIFEQDRSHFLDLYCEIHHQANAHPNAIIHLEYVGGMQNKYFDLQNLIHVFYKHPHLLPTNVQLSLSDGTHKNNPIPFNIMIYGTGGIDIHPSTTAKNLFAMLDNSKDCAYKLYALNHENIALTRTEIMPVENISLHENQSIPIRDRIGQPQHFVPTDVVTWASRDNPSHVSRIILHMQSEMNPPHPGHVQMLLIIATAIAKKEAQKGQDVELMIVAELAPEWYLQSKMAQKNDEIKKTLSFESRKKLMQYLGDELVQAQIALFKQENAALVDIQFLVNPNNIIFDHPDRIKQIQQALTNRGTKVYSVQGIDSPAWTYEQLKESSFLSLSHSNDFSQKITPPEENNAPINIIQAMIEFDHELTMFSSSKLSTLKDQHLVDFIKKITPIYTDFFLQKLENKIAKTVFTEAGIQDPERNAEKELHLGKKTGKTRPIAYDDLTPDMQEFLLAQLNKQLILIDSIDIASETLHTPHQHFALNKKNETESTVFKVLLKQINAKLKNIAEKSAPSPAKDMLNKKLNRDPFLHVLFYKNPDPSLTPSSTKKSNIYQRRKAR